MRFAEKTTSKQIENKISLVISFQRMRRRVIFVSSRSAYLIDK